MSNPERLPVAVSRSELHAIETVGSFETAGPFVVEVTNHGRDAHVHLKLDDSLARVATLAESNVYVERDATERVEVEVDQGVVGTVPGGLTVETGYGAESASVGVTVDGVEESDPVAVGEELDRPADADDGGDPAPTFPALPSGRAALAALGGLAVGIAATTAVFADDPVVVAGAAVVVVAVATAVAVVWR